MKTTIAYAGLFILIAFSCNIRDGQQGTADNRRPNILFVIADDQSFPHAGAYGSALFKTPAFDMVAERGILFTNAFVAAPQCSPSRAAILTGLNIWQLEEAGTHSSYFPKKFPVFTDALEASGYRVGYTGKAWGPGNWEGAGWDHNPVGKEYNDILFSELPYSDLSKIDYAANFKSFLADRSNHAPFFFWFGSNEPHRNYEYGSGRKAGLKPDDVALPAFLPQSDSIITDMLDYAQEISWFDQQLAKMISMLEESGELENTIIVVTADNGMPFPHAKANLHEYGIHVPLAICGPAIAENQRTDVLISLIDLAPTFLELAGAAEMDVTGKSLVPLLHHPVNGYTDTTRNFVLAGRERHTHARPDNAGYPARAIRTSAYLYVRNFKPDRWPVGDPPPEKVVADPSDEDLKPIVYGYEDIDDSPTKEAMIQGRERWPDRFRNSFEKRDPEELYAIEDDPFCVNNLADDPDYSTVLRELSRRLEQQLSAEGDPRVLGYGDVFESYPRFGRMRPFDGFKARGAYNDQFRRK